MKKEQLVTLKEVGNIKNPLLNSIITYASGSPDFLDIEIYLEARSWYKPKKSKDKDGNVIFVSKLKDYAWKTSYNYLTKKYHKSHSTIKRKLQLLENLNLIKREFKFKVQNGNLKSNIMYILVWKDTEYFRSDIGLERLFVTTPPPVIHDHIEPATDDHTPSGHENPNFHGYPPSYPQEIALDKKNFNLEGGGVVIDDRIIISNNYENIYLTKEERLSVIEIEEEKNKTLLAPKLLPEQPTSLNTEEKKKERKRESNAWTIEDLRAHMNAKYFSSNQQEKKVNVETTNVAPVAFKPIREVGHFPNTFTMLDEEALEEEMKNREKLLN